MTLPQRSPFGQLRVEGSLDVTNTLPALQGDLGDRKIAPFQDASYSPARSFGDPARQDFGLVVAAAPNPCPRGGDGDQRAGGTGINQRGHLPGHHPCDDRPVVVLERSDQSGCGIFVDHGRSRSQEQSGPGAAVQAGQLPGTRASRGVAARTPWPGNLSELCEAPGTYGIAGALGQIYQTAPQALRRQQRVEQPENRAACGPETVQNRISPGHSHGQSAPPPSNAAFSAVRMTSVGASTPVQRSNAIAPWWTNMLRPSTAGSPRSAAAPTIGVPPGR